MTETVAEGFRISPQQAHVWRISQSMTPGTMHCRAAIHLQGRLDHIALRKAIALLIDRYEILRTRFRLPPGMTVPLQEIAEVYEVPWVDVERTSMPQCSTTTIIETLFGQVGEAACDHEQCFQGVWLLSISIDEHVLVWRFSSLGIDNRSLSQLQCELAKCYEAACNHKTLSQDVLQFADVAEWSQQLLESAETVAGREFWLQHRGAELAEVNFLPSRPEPLKDSSHLAVVKWDLAFPLWPALRKLASKLQVDPQFVCLTAWLGLHDRWGHDHERAIGVNVDGRSNAELATAIGLFSRDLPLSGIDPAARFSSAALEVARQVRQLREWEDYFGFEKHFPTGADSFPIRFEYRAATPPQTADGITFREQRRTGRWNRSSLELICEASEAELQLTLQYDATRWDHSQAGVLMTQFVKLLTSVWANPETSVERLQLLDVDERKKLIQEATGPKGAYTTGGWHDCVAQQAQSVPDRIAVVCGENRLSYGALDTFATRVAHELQQRGVVPEVVVGLCAGRTIDFVIGLIGILKTGAAFCPLDVTQPLRRLQPMLNEIRPPVVLTLRSLREQIASWETTPLCIEDLLATETNVIEPSSVSDANLAYVLFTSGSTGRPKGVGVEHRHLRQYCESIRTQLDLRPAETFAHVSTLAADLGHTALFPPLMCGGTLHLIPEDTVFNPSRLAESFAREPVDRLKLTPSHLKGLRLLEPVRVLPRKCLVLGGESVDASFVSELCESAPELRVLNHYGPTEVTVGALAGWLTPDTSHPVCLGRPLSGVQAYVRDRHMALCPPGCSGELYLGGATVARGYHSRPAETAARFVPDSFATVPGNRLYRTGDRVRRRGLQYEFQGRIDRQIKLRGYRIELGEIETALRSHSTVLEAAAVIQSQHGDEHRLVAFVVGTDTALLSDPAFVHDLRVWLAERLPDYMVPAQIVAMPRMPLTSNGKLDRHSLAQRFISDTAFRAPYVPPNTPLEETLARIWSHVLNVPQVGRHDRFFDLGGHSLSAMQVVSRAQHELNLEVPLRALFEAPTIAGLATAIENARGTPRLPPLLSARREGPLPLSFSQLRLWFLDQLAPNSPLYNLPTAIRLSGALDIAALNGAFDDIIARHEILRTRMVATRGQPEQIVDSPCSLPITAIDLSGVHDQEFADRELQRLADQEALTPFDLARGPLLRARLIRCGAEEHVVLFTIHHIVSDGWSMGILMQELAAAYSARLSGQTAALPPLPVQYADFALWQQSWLDGDVVAHQLKYWKEQLRQLPVLSLPTDRPRPAVQSHRGSIIHFALPATVSADVERLCRVEGVTPFMVYLAALNVVLGIYSGQDDIAIGIPVANRTQPQLEGLIGFFVNSLVLRTDLSGNPTFTEVLRRARTTALDAFAHQDLPFERLVEELAPRRDLSRQPLFQVMLVVQNAPPPAVDFSSGVKLSALELAHRTSKFDLSLILRQSGDRLLGALEFNTDLFDATTAERFTTHFSRVLSSGLTHPSASLSRFSLIDDSERRLLLIDWNNTRQLSDESALITDRLTTIAARYPDCIAIDAPTGQVSYAALHGHARRLAQQLTAQGVRPEMRVGIALERSAEMLTCVVAILEAGAAFVPLDPTYPAERLQFMLHDADVALVITDRAHSEALPVDGIRVIRLDEFAAEIVEQEHRRPLSPENSAYVIYTSGSTGRPKGTLVAHRGLCNLLDVQQQTFRLTPGDRVLQFAPMSYDACVWEIVMALGSGATLAVPDVQTTLPGPELTALIQREAISVWTATPSALAVLPGSAFPQLRLVVSAGERCPANVAAEWGMARQFFNAYGPTETTVCATMLCCDAPINAAPTIGTPIANTQVYVLKDHEPLSVGIPGELHVAGVGLARGYLHRAAMTAERFVPNPFPESPGERIYRTGDLVRWRPNGTLDFLGRRDEQLKLHGHRIEPGEIEAALITHPAVQRAVVISRRQLAPESQLVAYLECPGTERPTVDELRQYLGASLPAHMIPAHFVLLDTLPLSPSGKIDRAALPEPSAVRPHLRTEYLAPRTPAETALANIWTAVLGITRIGINDNFFELGGDSILSIQVVARAYEQGLRITPRQVFEFQTIALLAENAGTTGEALHDQEAIVGPVPLTPIQHWFFEQNFTEPHHFNQTSLFELKRSIDPASLEAAIEKVLTQHDALRMRFEYTDGVWQQLGLSPEMATGAEILTQLDLTSVPADHQRRVFEQAAEQFHASLHITHGPLIRFVLARGVGGSDRLFVVCHHLVVDGVSWPLLLQDLLAAYEQQERQQPIHLLPKTTSGRTWAERLIDRSQTDELLAELPYWQRADSVPVELPIDHADGPNDVASEESVAITLDMESSKALLTEAPQAYRMQVNEVLLTALAQALAQWTGRDEFVVAVEGHGREELFDDVDLSRTVGWFTTLYPLVLNLDGVWDPGDRLKRIKETCRRVPQRGIGYGLLRYLHRNDAVRGELKHAPPPIRFNFLGQIGQNLPTDDSYAPAREARGPAQSRRNLRPHLLSITAVIAQGAFSAQFHYSRHRHARATIEMFAAAFLSDLRELIAHCQTRESTEWTASDFPLANLDEAKLAQVTKLIRKIDAAQ